MFEYEKKMGRIGISKDHETPIIQTLPTPLVPPPTQPNTHLKAPEVTIPVVSPADQSPLQNQMSNSVPEHPAR